MDLDRVHGVTCSVSETRCHENDEGRLWEGQSVEKSEMYQLSEHSYLRCAKHTYNTRPFENGSSGRREEGLARLTTCTKNEKNEVKRPFLIPERSVQNERGVQNYTHNTKPF